MVWREDWTLVRGEERRGEERRGEERRGEQKRGEERRGEEKRGGEGRRGEGRKEEKREEERILVYLVNLLAKQFGLSATNLLTIAHSSACCLRSNTHTHTHISKK